ncbi:DNA cytosine methyltransferase [Lusitaniella coriacea]|uniref:DNA cytosine methyltransferase n=1 Tax=Lusitaniella coriacea TaxID=1983105 RepID=UPI003CF2BDC1
MARDRGRPVAVDLFAGAGGFSLGVEQAGFEVVVAVESDPVHAAVYAFNFPQTQVLRVDVTQLSGEQLQNAVAQEIDLLFGGPPCQGFSVMGKHNPKDDRNGLVFHFCRLVREVQPRYFVMENVPGLMHENNKRLLRRLKRDLRNAGYGITERVKVLNAADFRVPQDRRRLFLLGTRQGENPLTYPKPFKGKGVTVRDAIADLPDLDGFVQLQRGDEVLLKPHWIDALEAKASPYVLQLRDLCVDGGNFAYPRQWNPLLLTNSWQTRHTATSIARFRQTLPGAKEPISRLQRLDWEGRCYTLRAGTGAERGAHTAPRPLHPARDRVISVREAARLHSFPDWFRLHATKWHGFREVGNAVPPLLGRAIARQVLQALAIKPSFPSHNLPLGAPCLLRFTDKQACRYWSKMSH